MQINISTYKIECSQVEIDTYDLISIGHVISFTHLNNGHSSPFLCMSICYRMFNINSNNVQYLLNEENKILLKVVEKIISQVSD